MVEEMVVGELAVEEIVEAAVEAVVEAVAEAVVLLLPLNAYHK